MFWKFSLDNLIISQIEILYDYNIESFKQTIPIGDIELVVYWKPSYLLLLHNRT